MKLDKMQIQNRIPSIIAETYSSHNDASSQVKDAQ